MYFTYRWIKIIQVTLVILAGSAGFVSGILFGKVGNHFQKNCFLYANVSFEISKMSGHDLTDVNVDSRTAWGSTEMCELVTFEGILVFINSFIWLWFFLNMKTAHIRDRSVQEPRNAMFLLPPIVVKTVLSFLSVVRVTYANDGYQKFCLSLCNARNPCQHAMEGCMRLQYKYWVFLSTQHGKPLIYPFHDSMRAALIMSWLEPLFLATDVLVILTLMYLETSPPKGSDQSRRDSSSKLLSYRSTIRSREGSSNVDLLELPSTESQLRTLDTRRIFSARLSQLQRNFLAALSSASSGVHFGSVVNRKPPQSYREWGPCVDAGHISLSSSEHRPTPSAFGLPQSQLVARRRETVGTLIE